MSSHLLWHDKELGMIASPVTSRTVMWCLPRCDQAVTVADVGRRVEHKALRQTRAGMPR
jgi:hypothetical protein